MWQSLVILAIFLFSGGVAAGGDRGWRAWDKIGDNCGDNWKTGAD